MKNTQQTGSCKLWEGVQGGRQPEVGEGFLKWAKRGGGQAEGEEAKSNWMELLECYYMNQHQLTLCCKVLPRLTVMSYSADYNINSKPRCFGFRKPRALCSFYRLHSTLRCGHFHITDWAMWKPSQSIKDRVAKPQLYHHLHQWNHIHREALLRSGALKFPPHSLDLRRSIPAPSVPSVSCPAGLQCSAGYSGPWPACSLLYGLDVGSWIGPF